MFKRTALNIIIVIVLSATTACTKNSPDPDTGLPAFDNGFFIVNEGNFTWGNGSLDYFSYDSLYVYQGVFNKIAQKVLGDVAMRLTRHENLLYIVVNNSGKIEVLDLEKKEHHATINGLVSPRDIKIISHNRAIVSSLYSDSLALVDLDASLVREYINIGKSSECILLNDENIFVSNWSEENTVTVLSRSDLTLVKSIETAPEPSEMISDNNGRIWVICSGGYLNQYYPELVAIDPVTLEISKRLTFGKKEDSPSELVINSAGDTLYYLNGGIFRMSCNADELPADPWQLADGRTFYRLGFEAQMNAIIATDALDYVQKGYFYIYTRDGREQGKYRAGIIPGKIEN